MKRIQRQRDAKGRVAEEPHGGLTILGQVAQLWTTWIATKESSFQLAVPVTNTTRKPTFTSRSFGRLP